MWCFPSSQDQNERAPLHEIVAAAEPDLHATVRGDVESGEPSLSAEALACSKEKMVSARPGSEYWLP